MRIATTLGALDPANVDMGAHYAEACAWLLEAYENLARAKEARTQGEQCVAVADKVLERRPGYRLALHAQQVMLGTLAQLEIDALNPQEALRWAERQEQVSVALLNLDPNNVVSLNNLAVSDFQLANIVWSQGKLRESFDYSSRQVALMDRAAPGGSTFLIDRFGVSIGVAWRHMMVGDDAAGEAALAAARKSLAQLRQGESARPAALALVSIELTTTEAVIALGRSDYEAARRFASQGIEALRKLPAGGASENQVHFIGTVVYEILGRAAVGLGDYAAAEAALNAAAEARRAIVGESPDDQRWVADVTGWLAMAQARAGKTREAAQTLAPLIKFYDSVSARNHGDAWLPVELAQVRYLQSLTEPEHRAALLTEATHLLSGLSPQVQASRQVRQWQERIHAAQGAAGR